MTSSGIKRGLAATAISALAVAGIPSLATTAHAAPGDSFTVTYTGPALNGGGEGALVVLRATDSVDPANLKATSTTAANAGSEDNADQNVEVISATSTDDPSDSAFQIIKVRVAVTTSTTGATASFRIFEDDADTDDDSDPATPNVGSGTLDADEARQPVSITTAGALASIDVSPASQSAPEGVQSGPYTVTLRDSAGRTTQLAAGDSLNITEAPGGVSITETGPETDSPNNQVITSDEIVRGVDTFTASANAVNSYVLTVADNATPGINDTAILNVTQAAELTADEIDIVTAADSWDGFGDGTDGGTTSVRVDQNTVRFDFDGGNDDAGSTVTLAVDGDGVTFGGQDKASYTTTLDANGNGSITVVADAASVQEGDGFDVDINGFEQTISFDRATVTSIDGESARYFCQLDAACTVTAVVLDQFGNPVTAGEVSARRIGVNTDATAQRKPVGADGTVDFTFTDVNAVNGSEDQVRFEYFTDQFDNTGNPTDQSTVIEYSTTGQGSDYVVSLDGNSTESPAYTADSAAVIPLWDTVADTTTGDDDEDAVITLVNGENGVPATLSVDGGALILEPGETRLSQGSASVTATLNGTGNLPAGYRVVGTKSGQVTLSVSSGNRTETAKINVKAQDNPASARNVTLTAPATVPAGTDQITFTAVVTDAFGNPVPGVSNAAFNKQVTGPGEYQDGDSATDAMGMLKLNVRVDGPGDITMTVDGAGAQFGAAADRLTAGSTSNDGAGLTASSDVASATTTVEEGEETGPRQPITAELKGRNTGKKVDKLKVVTMERGVADGARVNLYRFNKNGVRVLVESSELNANGIKRFQVKDTNGKKKTKYVARVKRTDDSKAVKRTNFKRVR